MNTSQRVDDYLRHIQEAIERINGYVRGLDLQGFLDNLLVQDAVLRNLEIIGEASHRILEVSPDFASEHDEIRLIEAYQMRNVITHGYLEVDMEIVWHTVTDDLPSLQRAINEIVPR